MRWSVGSNLCSNTQHLMRYYDSMHMYISYSSSQYWSTLEIKFWLKWISRMELEKITSESGIRWALPNPILNAMHLPSVVCVCVLRAAASVRHSNAIVKSDIASIQYARNAFPQALFMFECRFVPFTAPLSIALWPLYGYLECPLLWTEL